MMVPQSMGYAMLAGLPPVYGLYTAFIPLLLYPFFGSSLHMIVGCAAVPSILTFSSLSQIAEPFSMEYVQYAGTLSLLCGAFLLFFALTGLGKLARFISAPVVLGYTLGAALVIMISQIKYLFQFDLPNGTGSFNSLGFYISHLKDINTIAAIFGLISIMILLSVKRINKKIPGALIVMLMSIAISYFYSQKLIGLNLVGEIPAGLPSPKLDFEAISVPLRLIGSALVLSFVIFIQSLSIARTLSMKGQKETIDPKRELLGLSVSNLIGYVFYCYPVAGSLTRSAVNFEAGSRSGISSIISGALILLILLFFTPYLAYLPFSVLAAIVIVAVFKFLDFEMLSQIFRHSKTEGIFAATTATLTFMVNVQTGILAGVGLYLFHALLKDKKLTSFVDYIKNTKDQKFKLRYYHLDEVQRFDENENQKEELDLSKVAFDFTMKEHFKKGE